VNGDRHAWIDASAGVAGDMLLGALIDAGADLEAVRRAVDAVEPAVRISTRAVTRAGLRGLQVDVVPPDGDPEHRTWRGIRTLIGGAALPPRVRDRALAVFGRLAAAEAHVHGIATEEVHFHEVGAWDSIADVVGVCAALEDLGVGAVSAGEVAVGSGRVRSAHGDLPVPVPAVAELARGWRVLAGGSGELATPTGMAVIRALAGACTALPAMTVESIGVGAGRRDVPDRANVVRVVLGRTDGPAVPGERLALLETNVDDLDPRLWPGVLSGLLAAGAADAWLTPIVMKKGRPAHTLSALCAADRVTAVRQRIFRDTSTLGVRLTEVGRAAVDRVFTDVEVGGETVAVKVGHTGGVVVQVMPEFEDVAAAAGRLDRAERLVLLDALAAAAAAGLQAGSPLPPGLRTAGPG
jgi:pyridinium-3,5-bisthiocarboxylic acid mononucleotide nickel chelatase